MTAPLAPTLLGAILRDDYVPRAFGAQADVRSITLSHLESTFSLGAAVAVGYQAAAAPTARQAPEASTSATSLPTRIISAPPPR